MMRSQIRRALFGAVAVVAAGGVMSACGSSDSSSGTASVPRTSTAASPTSSNTAAAAPSAKAVTDYLKYVDGKPGKADHSLSPISIGWVNQQGGTVVPGPGATPGAELAVRYVNESLGGIDGHPIVLKTCFVRSAEEEGTTCGQRFLNDGKVDVVVTGAVATGIQSLYSTLAGAKPVVVGVSLTPVDSTQKNAAILIGDAAKILAPIASYGRDVLHAKTAALVYPNIPGVSYGAAGIAAALKTAGIKVKKVSYDAGASDLVGPLTAAGAQGADMVVPWSDPSGCANQAKALQQLGITDAKKIVSSPVCLTPTVAKALGGDFPLWTYAIGASLALDPTDPAVPPYLSVFKRYGKASMAPDPWTEVSFAAILTTVRWMNEVGATRLTPQAIQARAKAFAGPMLMGAPTLQCGKYRDAPAVCNDRSQFFRYKGKGQFARTATWLAPPA